MLRTTKKNTFHIEKWEIDPLHNSIQQGDTLFELEPKAMQVLMYLAKHAGETIDKLELQKNVWPKQTVTDAALTRIISQLRRCLADHPKSPSYIMTIKNTGYRLIAEVTPKNYFTRNKKPNGATQVNHRFSVTSFRLILIAFLFSIFAIFVTKLIKPTEENVITQYITADQGEEMAPTLSPNGKIVAYTKVVYSSNNKNDYTHPIFIKNIENQKVTRVSYIKGNSSHPVWSPDNRYIAFAHETQISEPGSEYRARKEIRIIDLETRENKKLIEIPTHAHGLTWSHNGKYLVFPNGKHQNNVDTILQVDVKTGEQSTIISSQSSYAAYGYPSFSPNDQHIAVIRTDQGAYDNVDLIDTSSKGVKNIFSNGKKISSLTWKDNETIFIASGGVASSQLLEFSIKTGKIKKIPIKENNIEYLSYSSKRKRLIFESIQVPYNIWTSTFSEDPTYVKSYAPYTESSRQELEAQESPNGYYTAIISSRSGTFEVWLRNNMNEQSQKITSLNAHTITGLDWTMQSDKIAFVASINDESALYWVSLKDKHLDGLSQHAYHYSLIGWERYGESLLFSSNQDNKWKLWRLDTNSKELELVSNEAIEHGRLSPDRSTLYFVKHKHSGIWRMDLQTHSTEVVAGTESLDVYRSWTVSPKGIYYFMYGDVSKHDRIYFQSFNTKTPKKIADVAGLHFNRMYWANNRLFYCIYDMRNSDVAMIEDL